MNEQFQFTLVINVAAPNAKTATRFMKELIELGRIRVEHEVLKTQVINYHVGRLTDVTEWSPTR